MSGQRDKQEMNDYVRDILRPRRETSAAADEALVAQSLARGATSAAATELRNRLESAQRGATIAREAQGLFLRLLHFRTLLPGAAQDGEQRALVLALLRQFRVAEEEYRVRFCGPDDEPLMLPGRLDRFSLQAVFDTDLAAFNEDAGISARGEKKKGGEEEEEQVEGPRVKIEVTDDDLSVKVVQTGEMREVKVEVDERRRQAALNVATRSLRLRSEEPSPGFSLAASPRHRQSLSYEPANRQGSPVVGAGHDAHARAPWKSDGKGECCGNVKQEEVELELGTVSQGPGGQVGFVDGTGKSECDEPAVKQEDDLRADGHDSDKWLYRPYMGDPDGKRGQVDDNEGSSTDDDAIRTRSKSLSEVETMLVDREVSVNSEHAMRSNLTGANIGEIGAPSASSLQLQVPGDIPHVGAPFGLPGLFYHHPVPFQWPTVALPSIDHPMRTPSPSPPAPRTPTPPATELVVEYIILAPPTPATSLERGQAPQADTATLPSTSGVQRRQAQRMREASAAPYVVPAADARQAWARSRILAHSPPDEYDSPYHIPPYSIRLSRRRRGEAQRETNPEIHNNQDDL